TDRRWVVDIRPRWRPHLGQAAEVVGCRAGRQRLVVPVQLIVDPQVLPECTGDRPDPPGIGSTDTQFLAEMRIAQGLVPHGARRVAGRGETIVSTVALIVVGVDAA